MDTHLEWKSKYDEFARNKQAFAQRVDLSFAMFDFDLVVYDEIEYFRDFKNPMFNYPFQQRKNKLSTLGFSSDPGRIDPRGNYFYH